MSNNKLSHNLLKNIGFSLLAEGKTIRVRADGLSMYPTVKPGSVISIEPFKEGAVPVVGEIIAWKKESGFVVHRLIQHSKTGNTDFFITRGDSSMGEDNPVTYDSLAGRVVMIESPTGKIIPPEHYTNNSPNYRLNRIFVWIILQISRVKRLFAGPAPIL